MVRFVEEDAEQRSALRQVQAWEVSYRSRALNPWIEVSFKETKGEDQIL